MRAAQHRRASARWIVLERISAAAAAQHKQTVRAILKPPCDTRQSIALTALYWRAEYLSAQPLRLTGSN
jgi:hypothetical protein